MQSKQSKAGNSKSDISSNSHNQGSNKEEELIVKIADKLVKDDQTAFEIGQLINDLVELKGGIKYGCKTIERISNHPKIQRHSKQLRRYWGYYLVFNRYGDAIRKIAPKLGQSFYYELARLLRLGESGNGHGKAGDELVEKQILKYVGWKVAEDRDGLTITVDVFREEISRYLAKDANNDRANDDESSKSDDNDEPNLKEKQPHPDKKRRTSRIADLLSYDDKGFELVSDWFTVFANSDHLKSPNINAANVCRQVNRVAESLAAMIEFLISKNGDSELNPNIFKKFSDLAGKVGDNGMGNFDNCQNPSMKEVA